ncbi:MAG: type II secretion system secretin GspD [Kofleriaceae bacterium]
MVLLLCLVPAIARAETEKPVAHKELPAPGEDEQLYSCKSKTADVAISFKPDIELKELLVWVMGFTCKEFVYDPKIVATSRKVTIISPNKLSPPDAYRLFLVALSTINYTIVPKGRTLRVVESNTAKRETVPIYKGTLPDGNDQIVRYIYRPTYAQADSLTTAFTALKSDPGEVQLVGTMLLITDYASHVKDMLSLAKLIDVPKGADGIYLLPVAHADAKKLADELSGILGMQATAASPASTPGKPGDPRPPLPTVATAVPSKILVDDRTNTLIIAASEAGYNRVQALVERLDIALDIEGGTTFHVYRLGSAISDELAKTLTEAITGAAPPSRTTGTPGRPGPPPVVQPAAPDPTGGTAGLEGQVRVISDKITNSLIVMSSGRDFLAIREVIRLLDVPRRQVYIETMILEVTVGDTLNYGSSSHTIVPGTNGSLVVGGVQMPELKSLDVASLASSSGLLAGLLGKELASTSLLGTSIPSYGLLFQALSTSSNTNIVSAPSFIGLDNKEVKQKVGVNIPFERGSLQTVGSDAFNQTNIERKDLALELSITPHISGDDSVLLEIKHDANDLGETSALGPTWNTRNLETSVVVRNQQTVVVGGMWQEKEFYSATKVPILGDIPVLGNLFKYTKKQKRKTNLLVMLTPYIIKDQMDLQMIHERKLREQREFASSFRALDGQRYQPKIDYGRKRGLIEEINRTLLSVEEDLAARESLRKPQRVEPGPIEVRAKPDDMP